MPRMLQKFYVFKSVQEENPGLSNRKKSRKNNVY